MFVTQRQLSGIISGLRLISKDLIEASEGEPVAGTRGKIVPVSVKGLQDHSEFLDQVATELLLLIDDDVPVEAPPSS